MSDTMGKAIALGDHLYEQYKAEGGGCENLMMEWAKERFYGLLVQDSIPVFDEWWQMLVDKGHRSRKTSSEHGDWDYSAWAEKTGKDNELKVIVSTCHCAMRDDNTYIYIRAGFQYDGPDLDPTLPAINALMRSMSTFQCHTVWPREKKSRYARQSGGFGDHRDIAVPSLNTFRKDKFKYGYGDFRDDGHVFNFHISHRGPVVEKAYYTELGIPLALDNMQWLLCDLRGDHE